MSEAAGYVLKFSPQRLNDLTWELSLGERFAEPVPEFAHPRSAPLVCFVLDERGDVRFVADARRGVRAGTHWRRLNLEHVREIAAPKSLGELAARVASRHRRAVTARVRAGGKLTPRQFTALADELVRVDGDLSDAVRRFTSTRRERIEALSSRARDQLAQQKEAVGAALELSGLTRSSLVSWEPPAAGVPSSFLDGLSQWYGREDALVQQDMKVVPGLNFVRNLISGAASFSGEDGTRVTVLLANKLPLEQLTGADLIYFNETFRAFVMVQYKMMERGADRGAMFRLPDAQLEEEVRRMDALTNKIRPLASWGGPAGYRLTWDPFFLKLCPRIQFHADSSALSSGMYLPLEYWKELVSDPSTLGSRGGRRVTFENARRHFDNTSFAALVGGGWVGTTPAQSAVIAEAVRGTLESGRAAVIAVRSGPDRGRRR